MYGITLVRVTISWTGSDSNVSLVILFSSVSSDELDLVDNDPLLLVSGGEEELLHLQHRPGEGPGLRVVLGVAVLSCAPTSSWSENK